ncbi:MAG: formate dehydrogenase, partial [Betaproteobacteria bacterium]
MTRSILFEDHSRQQTKFTTCYMCACRCGIKVTLENGKIRFIQGNRNHPVNQGVLCAKGAAGIMKQYSPARLRKPLMRRPGSERGAGDFVEIEWDEALDILTRRLAKIRSTNPAELAFFTGRDQMQALSGLWAQQFGTPNWAAHGGFCSVNMAVAGLYTIGYSFWEFGAPDWDHAKYFLLWGVAEDHSSNPIKIGLDKLKRRGAKFVSINPVRTGYSAIADEWVPIRPGTDGLFALALAHVLIKRGLVDWEFLIKYTNAPWLVVQTPGMPGDGLFARDGDGNPLIWDTPDRRFANGHLPDIAPALLATVDLPDGRRAKTVFSLITERYLDDRYAPEAVAAECGVPAETIHRIALEIAQIAFNETVELPIRWTDMHGRTHDKVVGRPVAMHAMRGISAHSNGFQTCRALHLLQM